MKISPVPKDDYDVQETRETSFDDLDKILNVAENAVIEREKPAKIEYLKKFPNTYGLF